MMAGMSDVLQVMGAMVIFSLVLLNVNRFLLLNDMQETTSEIEYAAITQAQDVIERARVLPFDAATAGGSTPNNVPDDFTTCGQGHSSDWNDFDDYDAYSETQTDGYEFTTTADVCYVSASDYSQCTWSKTIHKRMVVTVSSPYLDNDVSLSFIRTYY